MADGFDQTTIVASSAVPVCGHCAAAIGDGFQGVVIVISPACRDVRVLLLLGNVLRLQTSITIISVLGLLTGARRATQVGQVIRWRCTLVLTNQGNLVPNVVGGNCSGVKRATGSTRTGSFEVPYLGLHGPSENVAINLLLPGFGYGIHNCPFVNQRHYLSASATATFIGCRFRREIGVRSYPRPSFPVVSVLCVRPIRPSITFNQLPLSGIVSDGTCFSRI